MKQKAQRAPASGKRVHVAVRMPFDVFLRFKQVAESERRNLGDQALKMIESGLSAYESAAEAPR